MKFHLLPWVIGGGLLGGIIGAFFGDAGNGSFIGVLIGAGMGSTWPK